LIREIVSYLPETLTIWLDENNLALGSDLSSSLKNAISDESDLVIFFVSNESLESDWVKKELLWALEREKDLGHIFIFPIVLDKISWDNIEPSVFRGRKYLLLQDYEASSIKELAKKLEKEIFNWLVNTRNLSPKLPTMVKNFSLELHVSAGNLVRIKDLHPEQDCADDALQLITRVELPGRPLKLSTKKNRTKSGLPNIRVQVVNIGEDIQIESLSIYFKRSTAPLKDRAVIQKIIKNFDEPEQIEAVGLEQASGLVIKSNHKEDFDSFDRLAMCLTLQLGIKNIIARDVSGTEYLAPTEEIESAEKYLSKFYSANGIDELYDQLWPNKAN
jgi:hypothetical protein